jgi:2-amino-4-hydroxy-6-hydroxymethyldihydropteridine diphosphokinase
MKHKPVTVYLGLGSNLGDREQNLARAMDLLAQRVKIEKTSSIYVAEPVGLRDQPLFLNAVCRGQASLDPEELLGLVKRIEASLGRKAGLRNGPRPIDIDILFYGDSVVNLPHLVIPHPGVPDRAFVLVPLAEIAPDLVHPVNGRTVAGMAGQVRDRQGVRLWRQEAWNV